MCFAVFMTHFDMIFDRGGLAVNLVGNFNEYREDLFVWRGWQLLVAEI